MVSVIALIGFYSLAQPHEKSVNCSLIAYFRIPALVNRFSKISTNSSRLSVNLRDFILRRNITRFRIRENKEL